MRLLPGTVNLALEVPWHPPRDGLRIEPPGSGEGTSLVPCEIDGIKCFILRTDTDDAGNGRYPPTVIEVAAPVDLRNVLALMDGDTVDVAVSRRDAGSIDGRWRLATTVSVGIVAVVLGLLFAVLALSFSLTVAADFLLGIVLFAGVAVWVTWMATGRFWRQAGKL